MDTKKLRQKILDLAIHGKLVPQDPNDEPASVLLERIRAEKEKLIKEGKIKAPKKSKSAGDTSHYPKEVPFEVPEGWCWTTIGDCLINRDGERIPISSEIRIKQENKVFDYYGAAGVIDKVDDYLFNERLLLIGEDGANLLSRAKDNAFFAEGKYWVNNHAHILDATRKPLLDYIALYINSIALDPYITGSAQPKLNQDNLNRIPVPLPPFMEQLRIIDSMAKSQVIIDIIAEKQKEIVNAISLAKSIILDLAIHGKLVPQDPSDEPAIELLKRINPDFVPSDNLHYGPDVPTKWQLCHIQDIASVELGKTLDRLKNSGEEKPYLCALNVKWDAFDLSTVKTICITPSEKERYAIQPGDLLVCEGGDVGRSAIWTEDREIYYQNALHRIRFKSNDICPVFFLYVLRYYKERGIIDDVCKGVTIKHFTGQVFRSIDLPFPPVSEQRRIVKTVKAYYKILDEIVAGLD